MDTGIDYGFGKTNIDKTNGIRYGVISMHDVTQAWADSSEAQYGEPSCPDCGNALIKTYEGKTTQGDGYVSVEYDRYRCETCNKDIDDELDIYPEDPIGFTLDDGEYRAEDCLDSDIVITKSPYYTFAQFCSPCVPGAGNLDTPYDDGPKCYCFGHDWFDDGKAPYIVYCVSDDSVVEPD